MSYSRWGSSAWYTYWCITDAECREDETFDICGITSFTYGELKKGIDGCIEKLKETIETQNENPDKSNAFGGGKYTDEEYEELKGYMRDFMEDIENEYDTPSQRYRDGEITLEDAFIEEV